MNYANHIASVLEKEIGRLPNRFFDSFDYTSTGRNFTHPLTWGLLTRILWQIEGVGFVAIDFRLNKGQTKFQPDLTALSSIDPFKPLLFVDYESPNSCDTRIPYKDVSAYIEWSHAYGARVPYVIITTLPNAPASDWQLRYASKGTDNARYKSRKDEIVNNPFKFWYADYKAALKGQGLDKVYFINIDGRQVEVVKL
jgi:hypothetical protein